MIIYKNKIIFLFIVHLCAKKNYLITYNILNDIILKIKFKFCKISPIYVIEKAIFNIMIPIKIKKNIHYKNVGISIHQSVTRAIISIINYSKLNGGESISHRISSTIVKIYNKEHILYKNKSIYLHNILK